MAQRHMESCTFYRGPHVKQPTASGIVLSYAVRGSQAPDVLRNGLAFISQASAIVHLGEEPGTANFHHLLAQVRRLSKEPRGERIILNKEHFSIHKNSPSVLGAHLSNLEMCEREGMPCAGPGSDGLRFVLMPSNVALFRPGISSWVLQHSMSFCTEPNCADLAYNAQQRTGAWALAGWQDRVGELAWSREPPSPLYTAIQDRGSREDDAQCLNETASSVHLQTLLRSADAGNRVWRRKPIGSFPHEGSFYPVHLLRAFVRCALPSSRFEALLPNGSISDCLSMYQTASSTKEMLYGGYMGGCQLDENLLPTFAWQHYRHLIPDSCPPLAVRLWITAAGALRAQGRNRTSDRTSSNFAEFGRHLLANPREFGHIFGLKAPKHEFQHMVAGVTSFLPSWKPDQPAEKAIFRRN